MRFEYVPDGDILMIYLSDEPPFLGDQTGNVIVHTDKQGLPVQLEILDGKAVRAGCGRMPARPGKGSESLKCPAFLMR